MASRENRARAGDRPTRAAAWRSAGARGRRARRGRPGGPRSPAPWRWCRPCRTECPEVAQDRGGERSGHRRAVPPQPSREADGQRRQGDQRAQVEGGGWLESRRWPSRNSLVGQMPSASSGESWWRRLPRPPLRLEVRNARKPPEVDHPRPFRRGEQASTPSPTATVRSAPAERGARGLHLRRAPPAINGVDHGRRGEPEQAREAVRVCGAGRDHPQRHRARGRVAVGSSSANESRNSASIGSLNASCAR